jgi:hypothetical protein
VALNEQGRSNLVAIAFDFSCGFLALGKDGTINAKGLKFQVFDPTTGELVVQRANATLPNPDSVVADQIAEEGFFLESPLIYVREDQIQSLYQQWKINQIDHIPVVVREFQYTLPNDVNYITAKVAGESVKVPTDLNVTVDLIPTYSRSQMSTVFGLNEFANGGLLTGGKGTRPGGWL